MTLHQMRLFALVAKHLNLRKVSEELHISQPSVSTELNLLEKEWGVRFHEKIGRGIELTEAGRIFQRGVRTILKQHKKLKQSLNAAFPATMDETLTVGGTYSPSASLLPSLLVIFRKKHHPQIQLTLRTDNWRAIQRLILNSEVDIAVVSHALPSHSLTIETYREEPLEAFVAVSHPLARKQKLTLRDFERTPFVIRTATGLPGTTEKLLKEFKKRGFSFSISMRCESPDAVKMAVKKKMGVGILFKNVVEADVRRGDFKIIKMPGLNLIGESYIIYPKDRPLSPNAQEFLALLRQSRRKS